MDYTIENLAILILAAGKSSRLGSPKQLLAYNGLSLLKKTVRTAIETGIGKPFVVIGAYADQVREELKDVSGINLVLNSEWEQGMASSIKIGMSEIMKLDSTIDAVIILVCDQPFLTGAALRNLVQAQRIAKLPIAASIYDEKPGNPALFHKSFFPPLMNLVGDKGAKKLIADNKDQVVLVPFEEGAVDIDTRADYEKLTGNRI